MNHSRPRKRQLIDGAEIGFREIALVGHYEYSQASPPLKPHVHKNIYEFSVLEQGMQTYVVNSHRYELKAGDLLITRPGEIHDTGGEPENKGRLYWLQLRSVSPGETILGLSVQNSSRLLKRLINLPYCHLSHAETLIPTLERVFKAYADRKNELRTVELQNLLLRFILDMLALAESKVDLELRLGINRALTHIESHLADQLTIKELARIASTSESHFKKVFKRQVGISPIEYHMQRRIEHGKKLLYQTDCSVLDVALDLGFATSQHFATVFKRFVGQTPSRYRRRVAAYQQLATPQVGDGIRFHPRTSWQA